MSKELSTTVSSEALEALRQAFPQDPGFTRTLFPRIGFVSQNKTEGKGKAMHVVTEAGTFIEERETDELDENGKKIWSKTEIGTSIEGIIFFQRKQLRYYDEAMEEFTSSPIFDDNNEVVPLFCNRKEVARGTAEELKALYQYTDKDGKIKSRLEENRILYVLMNGEIFQLNLRGSSMYSFLGYTRKTLVPSVVTAMASEPKEKGSIEWNQMTFTPVRNITEDEVRAVLANITAIKTGIADEKAAYGAPAPAVVAIAEPNEFESV